MVQTIENAPTLTDFCRQVASEEKPTQQYDIFTYDLKLKFSGQLFINTPKLQGVFMLSEVALSDLADIAEIYCPYFMSCDDKLRAVSFNYRLRRVEPEKTPMQIVLKDGVVDRISNRKLLCTRRYPILDTILNAMPERIPVETVKVMKHTWNGQFDISVIAPTLHCTPRPNDIVAFGVNISDGHAGAIQVQGAAFRCICSNGAVNRVCSSRQHRLRRPGNNSDGESAFLQKIATFLREAWNQADEHARGLEQLTQKEINPQQLASLHSRLRQAPFFLSAGIIKQVLQQMEIETAQHGYGLTLYDAYNAMTYLGTHNQKLSSVYRNRL
jgi:hypothetical protein